VAPQAVLPTELNPIRSILDTNSGTEMAAEARLILAPSPEFIPSKTINEGGLMQQQLTKAAIGGGDGSSGVGNRPGTITTHQIQQLARCSNRYHGKWGHPESPDE